jgi:O-antigen/teichoic acid export membrane protein
MFAVLVTVMYFMLVPSYGFLGASYAVLISNLVLFIFTYNWSKKYLDLGIDLIFFWRVILLVIVLTLADVIISLENFSFLELLLNKVILVSFYLVILITLLVKNRSTSTFMLSTIKKLNRK